MEKFINTNELETILLVNWTKFINPNKMIAFILSNVRDTELKETRDHPPINKTSIQITLSQFRPAKDGSFIIWADFVIPREKGIAIGTCELKLDPFNGVISHIQTLGNIFTSIL